MDGPVEEGTPDVRKKNDSMRKAVIAIAVALVSTGMAVQAHAVTQRRINTAAASLYRVHLALVEEPGVRRPEEPLAAYFGRLLVRQPGEKPVARHARVAAYLNLLVQAANQTATLRKLPALRSNSAANRALWQQISLNLQDVEASATKLSVEWAREEANPGTPTETAKALTKALWQIQNAYAALRDALP